MSFATDRVRLRELRQSDKEDILALFNDYGVQESGGIDYTVPRGDVFFERWSGWAKSCTFFSILETKGCLPTFPAFIGFVALNMQYARNRDAEFSIAIVQSEWNKGYGTEVSKWMVDYAFRAMNMHRVSLNVSSVNEKAINLYKRIGFREEGRRRAGKWAEGKWVDTVLMGMTEEEFWDRSVTSRK